MLHGQPSCSRCTCPVLQDGYQRKQMSSIDGMLCLADRDSVTVRRSTRDSNSHTPDRLQLVPQRCSKTVHFIRHGEGFHNIGYEGNVDAHLTPYGWHQAAALGEHIRSLQPPLNLEVRQSLLHALHQRCMDDLGVPLLSMQPVVAWPSVLQWQSTMKAVSLNKCFAVLVSPPPAWTDLSC